jgi:hypothetical protein
MRASALIRGSIAALALVTPFGVASAQDPTGQPAGQPTAKPDDPITQLKKLLADHPELIDQLRALLKQAQTEKGIQPAKPGQEPDIPPIQLPGDKTQPVPTPGAPGVGPTGARATLTPDISVIGNNIGRFLSVKGDPDRNRLQLGEFEIGLQQRIFPGIRFDAFLAGGAEEDFAIHAEEAYATFSQIGHLPLGGLLGQKRLNFGKINPVHPHARPYIDQPAVLSNLLGTEALSGNGASVNYLFPFKNLFANLEVGLWKTNAAEEGLTVGDETSGTFYPTGLGITGNFPMARLWLSKEVGKGELELGASHGFGRTDIGDRVNLTGVDFTYRNFPGPFKRFQLQGEVFWHHRKDVVGGAGGHTRSGHYALLSYRPDQYTEYGFR